MGAFCATRARRTDQQAAFLRSLHAALASRSPDSFWNPLNVGINSIWQSSGCGGQSSVKRNLRPRPTTLPLRLGCPPVTIGDIRVNIVAIHERLQLFR